MDSSAAPTAVVATGAHQVMDPTLQPALAETVRQVTLEATDTTVEIAPGVKFAAWTFGGTVPGPVVHVRSGIRGDVPTHPIAATSSGDTLSKASIGQLTMPHNVSQRAR
jgi:hypothetical protein